MATIIGLKPSGYFPIEASNGDVRVHRAALDGMINRQIRAILVGGGGIYAALAIIIVLVTAFVPEFRHWEWDYLERQCRAEHYTVTTSGRAVAALARLGCEDVVDRQPGTLPYAVQKRVALARALACDPELLMLDEPAGGLDARELTDLGELIGSLGSSVAVMLVDHHMDFVVSVCDRVVVLDFGRVIADGDPMGVVVHPRVVASYLGDNVAAINRSGIARG